MPPERLLNEVKTERMISGLLDMAKPDILDYKDLVGDAECLAYMMPGTGNPLSSDWTKIYLWLACRILKRWKIEPPPELKKESELSDYEQNKLNSLRAWIYKRRGGREQNAVINSLREVFNLK